MTLHYFSGEPDDAPLTPLQTITPADWKDIEPVAEQWFALNRILGNDLTIMSGDGGAGNSGADDENIGVSLLHRVATSSL